MAGTVALALIVGLPVLWVLVLLLTTQQFRTLADAAGARWARRRGPEGELRAIARALPRAGDERRAALHDRVVALHDRVVALAELVPDDAAEVLAGWPSGSVPPHVGDGVVAAWARHGLPHRFPQTWSALSGWAFPDEGDVSDGPPDRDAAFVTTLLAQLRTVRPAPGFGLGAVAFLEERLWQEGRRPVAIDRDLELLERVLPPGLAGRVGVWQAVLGDAAARAGQPEEARRRWRLAVDAGVAAARPRLAHSCAEQGRDLVLAGDAAAGAQRYAEAYRLTSDLEYRLGELVARVVEDRIGRAVLAEQLDGLVPGDPEAALWAGLAHAAAGDLRVGAPLLRRAEQRVPPPRRQEVTRLAEASELDDEGLRALGRSLLDAHGAEWARHTPVPPDRIVGAVADPADTGNELLERLLAGYPQTPPLRRAARERAAHAVLATALRRAGAENVLPRLDLAERLLAEDA